MAFVNKRRTLNPERLERAKEKVQEVKRKRTDGKGIKREKETKQKN